MKEQTKVAVKNLRTNISNFLNRVGQNTTGYWSGKMSKAEQLECFDIYLGKGIISVDGKEGELEMLVKVCFGQDIQEVRGLNANGRVFDNDPTSKNSLY